MARIKRSILAATIAITWAQAAAAQEQPTIAPAAAWVEPAPLPEPLAADAGKPFQMLLSSIQTRFGPGMPEVHFDMASRIQSAEALAAMGTIVLGWQPDQADLIIHKVEIVRDGKAIDVLARGEKFTVIRREAGLERAMMDGVLSAVLQPSDLQVGDILRFSYTLRRENQRIAFKGENFLYVQPNLKTRLVRFRQLLPSDGSMRWKASSQLGEVSVRKTALGQEVLKDLRDIEHPKIPGTAPQRFQLPLTLEVSQYRDWAELSALQAPIYDEAAAIGAASPLRAEIAAIAKAHATPEARALAALRLVQDRVRYVFRGMGEGGFVPTPVDQTWALKYGDCKAKTVMLLGVLEQLGIAAEPALVSSSMGDLLPQRLPMMGLFDHVIVRAEIGGRTVWLDGTRVGDRVLDNAPMAGFAHALPLRNAGAALTAIEPVPPALPLAEQHVTIDARRGLLAEAPIEARLVWRGDQARMMQQMTGSDAVDARNAIERDLRKYVSGARVSRFESGFDEASGAFTATLNGAARIAWPQSGEDGERRYRFSGDVIAWEFDFDESSDYPKLPVRLGFPTYFASTETILLPADRGQFRLDGRDVDETVGGTRIARTVTLAGGKAVSQSIYRRLKPEITAAEAVAAENAVKRINAAEAHLLAPAAYRASAGELKAVASAETPTTATGFVQQGAALIDDDRHTEALIALDKAIALSPDLAEAYVYRSISLADKGDLPGAKAALDKAAALGEKGDFAQRAHGYYHLSAGTYGQAVAAFTRAIEFDADDTYSLTRRSEAYRRLGALAEAEADLTAALAITPDDTDIRGERAEVRAALGDEAGALDDVAKSIAARPGDADAHWRRGALLTMLGRDSDAKASYATALKLLGERIAAAPDLPAPRVRRAALLGETGDVEAALADADWLVAKEPKDAEHWNTRCWTRAIANTELDKALADCDRAVALKADSPASWDSRGFVKLRQGRLAEAIADFDKAIALNPRLAAPYYARAIARLRKGDRPAGERDLRTARRLAPTIDATYRRYGVTP